MKDLADAGKSRWRGRRSALRWLTAVNGVFLLLLWIAERFIAERWWVTTLLAYLPQHAFGVPAALLLLWSLGRRDGRALAGNSAALAFFLAALLGLNVPLRFGTSPSGPPLRVMTYNIHHGSGGAAAITAAVERERPDILCLQEANPYKQWPDPVPELQQLLPGWHAARHGELATFARHPIRSQRAHPLLPGTGRVVLETAVQVDGLQLTVLNVHISTAAGPHSLTRRPDSLPAYLRHTAAVRADQVSALLRITDSAPPPLLIAGDFNTPPRGLLYHRMTGRFRDAFQGAGWGLGHTYPAHLPLLRIDYLFAGEGIDVRSCSALRVGASDHRPVVTTLALRGTRQE